jgi:hypothetical protein
MKGQHSSIHSRSAPSTHFNADLASIDLAPQNKPMICATLPKGQPSALLTHTPKDPRLEAVPRRPPKSFLTLGAETVWGDRIT